MRNLSIALLAGWLSGAAHAVPMPVAEAASRFGALESAYAADLSPDGKRLIYLAGGRGSETIATLLDVASGQETAVIRSTGQPERLRGCAFATNEHVVCKIAVNRHYGSMIIGLSRSALIDLRTMKSRSLAVRDDPEGQTLNQFDGNVVDWLPDEQGAFLMQRNYAQRGNAVGVDRVQVNPFRISTVVPSDSTVDYFLTDGHGTVRFSSAGIRDTDQQRTGQHLYRYRAQGSDKWQSLPGQSDDFDPLLVDRSSNSLYYMDSLDGRQALFRMPLDGSNQREVVARHSQVDIDGPIVLGPGEPVIGYRYTDDRARVVYTDAEFAKLAANLKKAMPGDPLIDLAGMSRDRGKLLVFVSSPTDPGAYYVLDRATKEMKIVTLSRAEVDGVPLAPVKAMSFKSRDGAMIPAYVTAQPGQSGPRPTVILPHGGPSARDEWGFDWLAQFLAARGYTVVQPNFRGSSGYGDEFLGENAFRNWQRAMNDIRDSADWAVSSGLADPGRMAIVGWSYGGFAALKSAATDARYKAIVAIAPVTDLGALRRDTEGFENSDLSKAAIGTGASLREGSPVLAADAIKVPVLLVHGDLDSNVRVAHSQRMQRALQRAGAPVEFLRYKHLDHYLNDGTARTEMLTRIGDMLERTIGH
ncbi:S9 family peptidase [Sphingomonas sabuli]|uniref:S9 family peptidase n=1 Tax=Sphingomonas sabuli TaxID=2764186 RepID=A0A7G9L2N2_9SPHN|nr:S9 family peptidase [Sphingomonas sabuli]QNM82881.1 S9 family peptidase [Sphingomonas sabuli]